MKRIAVLALLLITLSSSLCAQRAIRLKRYSREIILAMEERIKYKLIDGTVDVGRIERITAETFVVNQREIRFDEVARIGRKGSGSNFFGIFLASFGTMLSLSNFANVVDPVDSCTSCPGEREMVGDGKELMLTMSMAGAGFLILTTHKTKNLEYWSIDTVDRPDR